MRDVHLRLLSRRAHATGDITDHLRLARAHYRVGNHRQAAQAYAPLLDPLYPALKNFTPELIALFRKKRLPGSLNALGKVAAWYAEDLLKQVESPFCYTVVGSELSDPATFVTIHLPNIWLMCSVIWYDQRGNTNSTLGGHRMYGLEYSKLTDAWDCLGRYTGYTAIEKVYRLYRDLSRSELSKQGLKL